MPTYDYECMECKHKVEISLGIHELDEVKIQCPICGNFCRRLITGGSGFLLKGEGWASDGYSEPIKDESKVKTKENGNGF